MKSRFFSIICFVLALALMTMAPLDGLRAFPAALAEETELTEIQRNAIGMLNYLTVLTKEINESKNSRLYMESAYSSLINNTYPNSLDSRSLSQLLSLLDIMEGYRMVAVKRERLQYIYEQNQAQAIRAAVPNPLGLLSAVQSYRPGKIAMAVVYMAVDSITSYTAYKEEADLQYLKDGWALDDEEAEVLHNSRKGAFNYLVNIVSEYDLPGDLTLTENTVDEFVKWKNDENVVARIQFLESNQKTYQSYGGYWLLLAESYYANGDYQKAMDAVTAYEALDTRIFRKDYELARILPLAISAAEETMDSGAYVEYAALNANKILENTEHDNWALRYFAAQTYIDLYGKTQDRQYLQTAYDVALDNVTYLIGEQSTLNDTYLAKLQEVPVPKDATKDEKKQIEAYNKAQKAARKTELSPVYEPLLLNCDLLFALADELGVDESEQKKIEGILHPAGERIFLTQELDRQYWFSGKPESINASEIEIEYGGNALILPVECVSNDASITVTIKDASSETVEVTDWTVDKVQRGTEGDLSTYQVAYTSSEAHNYSWKPDAEIRISVVPGEGLEPYGFEFVTHGTKNEWYDYLKVWEGHKNNWYDYGKVWENSVVFERVK